MPVRFSGARIVVMGLGRFGGGAGAARWAAGQDAADVLVTDCAPESNLAGPLSTLRDLVDARKLRLRLGEHREEDFAAADVVIVNPAVPRPWGNRFLRAAADAGADLTTEIALLVGRIDRSRVVGVTGTAGKSTTAAMIHHAMNAAGWTTRLGGNIGGSLLSSPDPDPQDWFVLELSSSMLYWLGVAPGAPAWSPGIAVLTNITANHLDWHGDFAHYEACKRAIFAHQQRGDVAIGPEFPPIPHVPLPLPGRHNQANAGLALHAASEATGVPIPPTVLADFAGLPHRLEPLGERGGVRFVNDSKSTTPASTTLAVDSFDDPGRLHLIAGGYDKQIDLKPIADLATRLGGLYTIGTTGPRLVELAGSAATPCDTLEAAVEAALARLAPGDTLLLSPGCASWDQFDSFEQRGERFRRIVGEIGDG